VCTALAKKRHIDRGGGAENEPSAKPEAAATGRRSLNPSKSLSKRPEASRIGQSEQAHPECVDISFQPLLSRGDGTVKRKVTLACGLVAVMALVGCASPPMGPTVAVMPAPNKSFDAFQTDQAVCKQYASDQTAGAAQQANNQAVGSAVIGTVLGAGLGAAIGGGRGAAIGAAGGAGLGTAYGANQSQWAQLSIQQRYDIAYEQCMYARGNQIPGFQPMYALPPPPM
jgi:uncharacterized protein YcfJ